MADEILLLECQNCQMVWDEKDLITPIPHLEERVSAGEPMPYGECPGPADDNKCGALCHPYEGDYIDVCPIRDCHMGQIKLCGFTSETCNVPVTRDGWALSDGSVDTTDEHFRCTNHGHVPSEWVFKRMSREDAAAKMQVKDAT